MTQGETSDGRKAFGVIHGANSTKEMSSEGEKEDTLVVNQDIKYSDYVQNNNSDQGVSGLHQEMAQKIETTNTLETLSEGNTEMGIQADDSDHISDIRQKCSAIDGDLENTDIDIKESKIKIGSQRSQETKSMNSETQKEAQNEDTPVQQSQPDEEQDEYVTESKDDEKDSTLESCGSTDNNLNESAEDTIEQTESKEEPVTVPPASETEDHNHVTEQSSQESLQQTETTTKQYQITENGEIHDKALQNSKQTFKQELLANNIMSANHDIGNNERVGLESRQSLHNPEWESKQSSRENAFAQQETNEGEGNQSEQSKNEPELCDNKNTSITPQDIQENGSHHKLESKETCEQQDAEKEESSKNTVDTSADNDSTNAQKPVKLQTLADLICVCRTKGLQVFDNVHHRPKSDHLLYSDVDLKTTDERGSRMSKRHRSDDRRASDRRKSQSTHRSKSVRSHNKDDMYSDTTSGYHVTRDRLNTGTSLATSLSLPSNKIREPFDRTTLGSRLSGRSGVDRKHVETDVDSEELLQQRMWRRSKRRRHKIISLADVVQERQKQIEAADIISKLHANVEASNMADGSTHGDAYSKLDNLVKDKIDEQTINQNDKNDTAYKGGDQGLVGDNDKSDQNKQDNEIQEYKIKDGNATLVLYKLKADTIQDKGVREKVLQETKSSQDSKVTDEKASLINNDSCQKTDTDSGIHSNGTNTAAQSQIDSKDNSVQSDSDKSEENTQTDKNEQKSAEDSGNVMETKRRARVAQRAKGIDSGIGSSESDKDSVKRNNLDRVKHVPKVSYTVNKTNRTNNGKTTGKAQAKDKTNKPKYTKHEPTVKRNSKVQGKEVMKPNRNKTPSKERNTVAQKDGNKKPPKSKRSLGNGLLVSDDTDDTSRPITDMSERYREMDRLYKRSKNINDLPKETRMVFIMAKIRERFDEEAKSQKHYLHQIQRARMELRGEYQNMKRDLGANGGELGVQTDGEDTGAEGDREGEGDENLETQSERETRFEPEAGTSRDFDYSDKDDFEPYDSKECHKSKHKIVSKIDTRWNPDHKLYPIIKSGFKSKIKIPQNKQLHRYLYSLRQQTSCRDLLNSDTVTTVDAKYVQTKSDTHMDAANVIKRKTTHSYVRFKSRRKGKKHVDFDKNVKSDAIDNVDQILTRDSQTRYNHSDRENRLNKLESVGEANETDHKHFNPHTHSRIPVPVWRPKSEPQCHTSGHSVGEHSVQHDPNLVNHYSYNIGVDDSRENHKIINNVANANRAAHDQYHDYTRARRVERQNNYSGSRSMDRHHENNNNGDSSYNKNTIYRNHKYNSNIDRSYNYNHDDRKHNSNIDRNRKNDSNDRNRRYNNNDHTYDRKFNKNQNFDRTSERNQRNGSKSVEINHRNRRNSVESHIRNRSKSVERHNSNRSKSVERHNRNRSKSVERNIRNTMHSVEQNNRNRRKSDETNDRNKSQHFERYNTYKSKSVERKHRNDSRSVDSHHRYNDNFDRNRHNYNYHVARRGQSLPSRSVSPSRTSRTTSSSTEVPMSVAVDIVHSRNKFYSDSTEDEDIPRGERIWQLYKDLQDMRQREQKRVPVYTGNNHVTGRGDDFLFMSYDTLNTPLVKQRTDRDFNKFLYGRFSYELCSKGRPLYLGVDRKEKALNALKQRVNSKSFLSGLRC